MSKYMLPLLALLTGLGACSPSSDKIITPKTITAQSLELVGSVKSVITLPDTTIHHDKATADCCCGEEGTLAHLKQEQTFDEVGRLLEEKFVNEAGEVQQTTQMTYDEDGRLLEKRTKGVEVWMNQTEVYTYDNDGRLIERKTLHSSEPAYSELFHYNSLGLVDTLRRTGEDLPTNGVKTFAYDSKGRCTGEEMFDSQGEVIIKMQHEYNELDSVTKTRTLGFSDDQITTYTYNEKGRLERKTLVIKGNLIEEVTYTYDKQGRITRHFIERTNGDGNEETTYEYGEHGLVKETFKGIDSMHIISYQRDKQGNWIERIVSNPETNTVISRQERIIKYY